MKYFKDSRCKKCGEIGAKSEFYTDFFPHPSEECIKRTCVNCGNVWHEEPLDEKETNELP